VAQHLFEHLPSKGKSWHQSLNLYQKQLLRQLLSILHLNVRAHFGRFDIILGQWLSPMSLAKV
jgi:hypothetical protein